jgi:hypothetical protein
MIGAGSCDPLVDLGLSYVTETGVTLSEASSYSVRSIFDKFVHCLISYHDAAMLLSPIIGTTQALDRVDRILRTPPSPLPPHQGADEPPGDSKVRAKARPWSPYEDQRLFAAVHRLGISDWHSVAGFVGNSRTKAQCYQRWTRGLDPHIDRTKWTPDEDAQLLMLVRVYGDKCWSKISAQIGNRCDLQCRSRYRQLARDDKFPAREKDACRAALEFKRRNGIPERHDAFPRSPSARPCLPPIGVLMAPLDSAGSGGGKSALGTLIFPILHQTARP